VIDPRDISEEVDDQESAYVELRPEPSQRSQRLDRYIAEQVSGLSRSQVQALIDSGHVRVDGFQRKASFKITPGEVVSVEVPPVQAEQVEPEDIPLDILYEDDDVIVIDKAAGMVVHPAPGHASGTLVNALRFHFTEIDDRGTERTGIVHRLDKDTTGVMIVAKHNAAMQALQGQWMHGQVGKRYMALVDGVIGEDEAVIDVPIARHRVDRKKMGVDRDGRSALTIVNARERFSNASLLDVDLRTGRTHQIRVHLAFIKHPILGDTVYGTGRSAALSQALGLKRQMLHAAELRLVLPSGGEARTFTAPTPADLLGAIDSLRSEEHIDG
jgi:23S rRNA pseudouridine1911/1915/1917 synthase